MTKTVVLDIGHGSNTFPTHGKGVRVNGVGYAEHNFNSRLAVKTEALLKQSGVRVVMLQKPFSADIPLATRTSFYNNHNPRPDLIVSMHADANNNPAARGIYAFYWHTYNTARQLAELIISEVQEKGYTTRGNGLQASRVGEWTNLHLARVPAAWARPIPSVLIEYGFMTNAQDFVNIFGSNTDKYTDDMAEATARGICRFLGIAYKGGNPSNVSTPPSSVQPSSGQIYTVKSGDTLWAIAQANGLSVEDLRDLNGLNGNIINPGQKLTVKKASDKKDEQILTIPSTYVVKPGDTLGEIANEFGLKVSDLVSWNNISNPNVISVGATFRLKQGATIPNPKPTSSKPRFIPGEVVRISRNATTYATGERMASGIPGRTDTIHSVGSDRVLLNDVFSWVRKTDIEGHSIPSHAILNIDGSWGRQTTQRLQEVLGTDTTGTIGGQVSNAITRNIHSVQFGTGGSMVVREMQRRLGVKADGLFGPITLKALQDRMGTSATGAISPTGSHVVQAMQRRLNENRF